MIAPLIIVCLTLLAAVVIAARALVERDDRRAQHARELAMHERAAAAPAADLAEAVRALSALVAELQADRAAAGPSRVGHRVTVHTKQPDDQTLFGVVVGDYTDRLALEDAEYVTPQGGRALPGRQDVATADIAWIDVHARVAVPDRAPAEAA